MGDGWRLVGLRWAPDMNWAKACARKNGREPIVAGSLAREFPRRGYLIHTTGTSSTFGIYLKPNSDGTKRVASGVAAAFNCRVLNWQMLNWYYACLAANAITSN